MIEVLAALRSRACRVLYLVLATGVACSSPRASAGAARPSAPPAPTPEPRLAPGPPGAGIVAAGPAEVRIVLDGDTFGPGRSSVVSAVDGRTGRPLPAGLHCRWVYQHTDLGFVRRSDNGCVAEIFVDPGRTRLSRFELDPRMHLYVIVTRKGERVGFAQARLEYVD